MSRGVHLALKAVTEVASKTPVVEYIHLNTCPNRTNLGVICIVTCVKVHFEEDLKIPLILELTTLVHSHPTGEDSPMSNG